MRLRSLWVYYLAGGLCAVGVCGCAKQSAVSEVDPQILASKVTKWSDALKSSDSKTRVLALNHLGNYGELAETFTLVAGALKDPEPEVRREAIRNMWKFEKKANEALAALTAVKDNDADPKLKADAQTMIKAIQDRQAGKKQ
jgi:HEAT repeat protein